jgi:hypothetical protein
MALASQRKNLAWGKEKFGAKNPNFNGGRYIDDKGYVRVLTSDHPFANNGYVYEHRLVAEKALGRYLQPWETVHHINEIKIDNRWENFFLTTVPEHSSIHREGKKQSKERKKQTSDRAKQRSKTGKRNSRGHFEKKVDKPDTLDTTEPEGNI